MKSALGKLVIVAAVVAIAISQAAAVTVPTDSGGTTWRGRLDGQPPIHLYYNYPGSCCPTYFAAPESIGHGYTVFNLTNKSGTTCTLKFYATRLLGAGNGYLAIYCGGVDLTQDPHARWDAPSTLDLLAGVTLTSDSDYACAIDPSKIYLGSNPVFLLWDMNSTGHWWQITNARLILN